MTLNEIMKNTADAIREKTGKSDLIAPVDFANEIKGITAGGESNIEYLDVRTISDIPFEILSVASITYKAYSNGTMQIMPIVNASDVSKNEILAVAVDFSTKIAVPESNCLVSVKEIFINVVGITEEQLNSIPRITKDEYYNLSYGAYVQHIDGSLYTKENWVLNGFNNEDANGVYITNGLTEVVIAKDTLGEIPWSSKPNTLIDGVTTTINLEDADRHNTGADDTIKIAAFDTDSAAAKCANYTFPNGQKGYLPSVIEMQTCHKFEYAIRDLMNIIGGSPFEEAYMWTSLQHSAENAWYVRIGMNDTHYEPKSNNYVCRPVCAYIKNE